MKNLSRFNMMA